MTLKSHENLPEWKERSSPPEKEGAYLVKVKGGGVSLAWWMKYPFGGKFQFQCGTEEGDMGWGGLEEPWVYKWNYIYYKGE